MKNQLQARIIAVLAVVALVFQTCIKTSLSAGQCHITCRVLGDHQMSFTNILTTSSVTRDGTLMLRATNANPSDIVAFTIVLPSNTDADIYKLHDWDNTAAAVGFTSSASQIGYSADGDFAITITKADNRGIEGTFSGKMKEDGTSGKTCVISNGTFKAMY